MKEETIKHLEFIQNIITRMNSNSFMIKGWCITLVSACLALYASSDNLNYIALTLMPAIFFWFLDSFYLKQERLFRHLYNDIVENKNDIKLFDMNIGRYKENYFRVLFSKTMVFIYLPIIILSICLLLILNE